MDCPVCMEQIEDFAAVPVNADLEQVCRHRFCGPCLERHLEIDERRVGGARCPLCRTAFEEINIIPSNNEQDNENDNSKDDDIQLVYDSGPVNAVQHASPQENQFVALPPPPPNQVHPRLQCTNVTTPTWYSTHAPLEATTSSDSGTSAACNVGRLLQGFSTFSGIAYDFTTEDKPLTTRPF